MSQADFIIFAACFLEEGVSWNGAEDDIGYLGGVKIDIF